MKLKGGFYLLDFSPRVQFGLGKVEDEGDKVVWFVSPLSVEDFKFVFIHLSMNG